MPSLIDLPWLIPAPADFAAACRRLNEVEGELGGATQRLALHNASMTHAAMLGRSIRRGLDNGRSFAPLAPFRLAVAASSTFDMLADALPAAAARHGVALGIVSAPYDQISQQASDPASILNRSRPDAVLLAYDHRWLRIDRPVAEDEGPDAVDRAVDHLEWVIENFRSHAAAPVILQTVATPPVGLFGHFDALVSGTIAWLIDAFNTRLRDIAKRTGSYLLDIAALAGRVGTDLWFDPVQWNAYKLPFAGACAPIYADSVGRLLGAIRGKSRKCLVLDLDNTVWGGVIGDDGIGGIAIGQGNAQGEAFLAIQQYALDLRSRGIVLAVCSKNDEAVARSAFREHVDMLLREEHIAVFQANWIDKASNLEAIAGALNIGLDALVFLDDNPAERAHVRAALPAVAVPELPADPAWYPWYLGAAGYFEAVTHSAEDRGRADSYAADVQRAEVRSRHGEIGDYLDSLEMRAIVSPFSAETRKRTTQLINKTNQFNLTTRRYTEAQVDEMERDPAVATIQFRLSDRYGDLGLIGIVICRIGDRPDRWIVDTWLMSCRVLGRQVEKLMLDEVVRLARSQGIATITGVYIATGKNAMVATLYETLGFADRHGEQDGTAAWNLDVGAYEAADIPIAVTRTWPGATITA